MAEGGLAGKVAIVTGGSSGIGRAAARALAAEGARVAIVARSGETIAALAREIAASGGEATAFPADVSEGEAMAAVTARVLAAWGRVDILVANAGVNTKERALHDIAPEQWERVIDTNLTGVFYGAKAVLPTMRERGEGTIIVVASMAGRRPGTLSGIAYGASKAGAVSVVHSINAEEKPQGIRATAILPGDTATAILDHRPSPPSADARERMLQPEDVAAAIVFVATQPHRVTIDELWITPTVQR
jgi:NADP-dependent 3-hydroxy acid dehydrogenase YdfG